jgi:hypothetical protein
LEKKINYDNPQVLAYFTERYFQIKDANSVLRMQLTLEFIASLVDLRYNIDVNLRAGRQKPSNGIKKGARTSNVEVRMILIYHSKENMHS